MTSDTGRFHEVFFDEGLQSLDAMEAALLRLSPGAPDAELINTVFRTAHSIKGVAGMFGFAEVAAFTHTVETLLDSLRSNRLQVTAAMCDGLLRSVDALRAMMLAQRRHRPLDLAAAEALQREFGRMIGGEGQPGAAPAVLLEAGTWRIRFRAMPALLAHGNDPLRMFEDLAGLGSLQVEADCSSVAPLQVLDPAVCGIAWTLLLTTTAPRTAIELVFEWAQGDCELEFERIGTVMVPAPPVSARPEPAATAAPGVQLRAAVPESIRVASDKLDGLLHTVAAIEATHAMLVRAAHEAEGPSAERLRGGLERMQGELAELRLGMMRVRMLPLGTVFNGFPRMVRDLATRLGKQIRVSISGEHTELDKTVLERISDPLVQLVRNSVDHGIESPAEREAAGKPVEGQIRLHAFPRQDTLRIVVSDDGRGLDARRLADKARSAGLVAADAGLTDRQAWELIFMPGFSTLEKATDLSGRGVGMDVVRRNVRELGGSVELQSEPGRGTSTIISLPLARPEALVPAGPDVAEGVEAGLRRRPRLT